MKPNLGVDVVIRCFPGYQGLSPTEIYTNWLINPEGSIDYIMSWSNNPATKTTIEMIWDDGDEENRLVLDLDRLEVLAADTESPIEVLLEEYFDALSAHEHARVVVTCDRTDPIPPAMSGAFIENHASNDNKRRHCLSQA